jgi:hypothetical protein
MDWLEAFKVIGSAAGIFSVIFLIYDRAVKNRPSVYLRSGKYRAEIAFANVANETLLIEDVQITPAVLRAAPGNDLRSTSSAAAAAVYPHLADKNRIFLVVEPFATRTLELTLLDMFESAKDADRVRIRCEWRNTRRPMLWSYSYIFTTVGQLRKLRQVSEERTPGTA